MRRPKRSASFWIWQASSRVGAMTSMLGPRGSGLVLRNFVKGGRRKARVLPLPVFAMPMMSRPSAEMGQQ